MITETKRPPYYIYPGLRSVTVIVPVSRAYYSPEERLHFIMQIVRQEFARRFEFDMAVMMSSTRMMPYAVARMAYYYFARMQCPTLTLREIGHTFAGLHQHHTTILHACTAIQNIIDTKDTQYYDVVSAIEERLK